PATTSRPPKRRCSERSGHFQRRARRASACRLRSMIWGSFMKDGPLIFGSAICALLSLNGVSIAKRTHHPIYRSRVNHIQSAAYSYRLISVPESNFTGTSLNVDYNRIDPYIWQSDADFNNRGDVVFRAAFVDHVNGSVKSVAKLGLYTSSR